MTVQSFTNEHITYETTDTACTCKAFQYGKGKPCKHMIAIQINRDETFAALRKRYDVRLNGDEDTKRCYRELSNSY